MGGPSNTTPMGPRRRDPAEAGGSSSPTGGGSPPTGGPPGSAGSGQGAGGLPPGGPAACPDLILAALTGPVQGLAVGMTLQVILDDGQQFSRVLVVDPVAGRTVGSVTGIPDLKRLIDCLGAGVVYRAVVTALDGGRIELRIVRQD